jgi:hypothetical protein
VLAFRARPQVPEQCYCGHPGVSASDGGAGSRPSVRAIPALGVAGSGGALRLGCAGRSAPRKAQGDGGGQGRRPQRAPPAHADMTCRSVSAIEIVRNRPMSARTGHPRQHRFLDETPCVLDIHCGLFGFSRGSTSVAPVARATVLRAAFASPAALRAPRRGSSS